MPQIGHQHLGFDKLSQPHSSQLSHECNFLFLSLIFQYFLGFLVLSDSCVLPYLLFMQFTCFFVSATLLDMSSFGIPNSLSACWVIKISAYTFRITVTFNLFRILKFVLVVGNCVYALENFFCSFFTPSGDVPDYCPFIKSVFTLLYSLFKFLKPL